MRSTESRSHLRYLFFFCPCANDSTSADKLIRFEGPRDFLHERHSHEKLQPSDLSCRRLLQRLATRDELSQYRLPSGCRTDR